MHRLTTRAAIMLLIATFATGCDASQGMLAETFTRAGTPAAASANAVGADGAAGQSISSSTHAGTGELPDAWPADIELPAGSHVGATTSIEAGDVTMLGVSGSVALDADAVREHFDEQFRRWERADPGWSRGVSSWTLGDGRARVLVGETGGGTTGFTIRLD